MLAFVLLPRTDSVQKRLLMIDHNVARGSHYVECILLGSEGSRVSPFKIIGVFST